MSLCGVFGSNSVEFASLMPQTLRAYSMTAHCIPRQIPKNGTFVSRARRIALSLPSMPRRPKPGPTRIASARADQKSVRVGKEGSSDVCSSDLADPEEWDFRLAREADRPELAFDAAPAEAGADEDRVRAGRSEERSCRERGEFRRVLFRSGRSRRMGLSSRARGGSP